MDREDMVREMIDGQRLERIGVDGKKQYAYFEPQSSVSPFLIDTESEEAPNPMTSYHWGEEWEIEESPSYLEYSKGLFLNSRIREVIDASNDIVCMVVEIHHNGIILGANSGVTLWKDLMNNYTKTDGSILGVET